ncbi:hypothetical protein ACFWXK_09060 [Streptomyces sp. NPDC059070]|uniref:hypothetical protein n=1 Tax=unclassified Streptomyces TaxID=2593676 RepID=UPI0034E1D6C3
MTWTKSRPATARAAILVRAAVSAGAVTACGLLLAACSSSTAATSADAKPGASASASASAGGKGMDAYRQCLAQHGVTPAPRPSGSGRPKGAGRPSDGTRRPGGGGFGGFGGGASADPARQQAAQACASLRPQFNGRGGGADSTAMKAFTSCLKDHGVVLPSASPGAGGGRRGFNTSDPKSAQAYEVCKALLPQRRSGAPSPSASPTA